MRKDVLHISTLSLQFHNKILTVSNSRHLATELNKFIKFCLMYPPFWCECELSACVEMSALCEGGSFPGHQRHEESGSRLHHLHHRLAHPHPPQHHGTRCSPLPDLGGVGERIVGLVFTETANRGLLTCSFQLPVRLLNQLYQLSCNCTLTNAFHRAKGLCMWPFLKLLLPCHMGSHISSSEDLSPVLESGCCYARNLSWLKIVPAELCST